ncbi:hypothetical protein [Pseudoalteromonas sp. RB2-MNA-CIBAN-0110]|uniref:hypothetical protein n=1 Tax=Pseudoalteromonas sp. RB2-MNA-CIBAN-0110 TaxID=3140439 RepID=UPI00332A4AEF
MQYNQATEFSLVVSDADNDSVQIDFGDDLNGAQISVIDAQALRFSYTPPANSITPQNYTLTATDTKDTTEFVLSVTVVDSTPATISNVTPQNSNDPVFVDSPVSITFSDIMLVSTLAVNSSSVTCTGSVQVSADNFTTCLALTIESLSGTTSDTSTYFHTVNLSASFDEDTQYIVRVTADLANFDSTTILAQTATSFTISSQDIKITELSSVQFSNDLPWIELYNGTGATVNLQDYSLKARSINMSDSTLSDEQVFALPNKELLNGAYIILQSRFGDDFFSKCVIK